MNLHCHLCGERLYVEDAGYISIESVDRGERRLGKLFFHNHCFEEAAGEEYVDALLEVPTYPDLNWEEKSFLHKNNRIKAIHSLRKRTGLGLKEAVDAINAYSKQHQKE